MSTMLRQQILRTLAAATHERRRRSLTRQVWFRVVGALQEPITEEITVTW